MLWCSYDSHASHHLYTLKRSCRGVQWNAIHCCFHWILISFTSTFHSWGLQWTQNLVTYRCHVPHVIHCPQRISSVIQNLCLFVDKFQSFILHRSILQFSSKAKTVKFDDTMAHLFGASRYITFWQKWASWFVHRRTEHVKYTEGELLTRKALNIRVRWWWRELEDRSTGSKPCKNPEVPTGKLRNMKTNR